MKPPAKRRFVVTVHVSGKYRAVVTSDIIRDAVPKGQCLWVDDPHAFTFIEGDLEWSADELFDKEVQK